MGENRNCCFEYFAQDDICLFFGGRFVNESSWIFSLKKLSGETVQIAPNFPAKSLSIYTTAFSAHPFDKLIETQLTTKIFEKK